MGCVTRADEVNCSNQGRSCSSGSWSWILREDASWIMINYAHVHWLNIHSNMPTYCTPTYLAHIPPLCTDVHQLQSGTPREVRIMLRSVIHKPLHPLVSLPICGYLNLFHMGEKVIVGLGSSLQRRALALLLCLCLVSDCTAAGWRGQIWG